MLHDLESEGGGLCIGVGMAGHVFDAFIQPGIAQGDGGVAAIEKPVDGLALLEPGQGAILPQNGGRVGEGALEPVVAAHQGLVAQLQALVEDVPEFLLVLPGGQGHVHQIDGDDTLVEPAVVLGLSIFVHIGREEGAAAHAGVAVALAIFVNFQLQHFLFRDIVRNHALCGALGGQTGQVPVGAPSRTLSSSRT